MRQDMYGMTTHIAKVCMNWVSLPILLVVSSAEKINIPLLAFAPENLVSRDGFGSLVPRQLAHLHTPVLTYRILPRFAVASIIYLKPPYAIGSVPSLLNHAIAYR